MKAAKALMWTKAWSFAETVNNTGVLSSAAKWWKKKALQVANLFTGLHNFAAHAVGKASAALFSAKICSIWQLSFKRARTILCICKFWFMYFCHKILSTLPKLFTSAALPLAFHSPEALRNIDFFPKIYTCCWCLQKHKFVWSPPTSCSGSEVAQLVRLGNRATKVCLHIDAGLSQGILSAYNLCKYSSSSSGLIQKFLLWIDHPTVSSQKLSTQFPSKVRVAKKLNVLGPSVPAKHKLQQFFFWFHLGMPKWFEKESRSPCKATSAPV